jgi:ribosomal protein S18 acetylase RimI-like enzyme
VVPLLRLVAREPRVPRLRPYVDADWGAVLDLCIAAFAPACEPLERLPQARSLAHADPDWRTCIGKHLRSLTRPTRKGRLLVAELRGAVVGVIHYDVDVETQSGSIGVSAVHPARQGKGIGTMMYDHVLVAMGAQGVKYATAETEGDAPHAPARRLYEKLGFVAVPMVHYFKRLVTPGPADAGRERRAVGSERRSSRPARSRSSSGIRGGRKRR